MIPTTLDQWNLDAVRRVASHGVFETDRYDLKEMLPNSRDEGGRQRLRRTIAAFANSSGGFLVIGVRDDRTLNVDERVVGVEVSIDLPEHFGAHASAIEPSPDWSHRTPAISLSTGRLVHVIEIKPSTRGPCGIFADDRWWFPKRTNRGTEPMSREEIRGAFVEDDRRRREIAWLKSEVKRIHDTAMRLNIVANNGGDRLQLLTRYGAEQLRAMLPSAFGEIGRDEILVRHLNQLIERCTMADELINRVTTFELMPRDQRIATRAPRSEDVVVRFAADIISDAALALSQFERLKI
jgi:hypothetical protein